MLNDGFFQTEPNRLIRVDGGERRRRLKRTRFEAAAFVHIACLARILGFSDCFLSSIFSTKLYLCSTVLYLPELYIMLSIARNFSISKFRHRSLMPVRTSFEKQPIRTRSVIFREVRCVWLQKFFNSVGSFKSSQFFR